MAVLTMASK